jgi:uncharacterized OsmC-like protein
MSRINNIDLEKINYFVNEIKSDLTKARKTQVLEGEWNLNDPTSQFQALLKYEKGEMVLKMDSPSFMGGDGNFPGPLHYCFYGLLSCYTGVFVATCSMLGVKLKKLSARVEADINFSRVFGLSDAPIMEEVRLKLFVESEDSEEKIREAEKLASERCPAVYTLTHPVKFAPSLHISKPVGQEKTS